MMKWRQKMFHPQQRQPRNSCQVALGMSAAACSQGADVRVYKLASSEVWLPECTRHASISLSFMIALALFLQMWSQILPQKGAAG